MHAVAGTAGGAITMASFYPLEIIRTYVQLDSRFKNKTSKECAIEIIDEEGIMVLYKGLGNTLLALGCSNFIYFYTNEALKIFVAKLTRRYGKRGILANQTVLHLGIASLAGVVNVISTCPLWVVNTRLKVQHKKSLTSTKSKTEDDDQYYTGFIDGITKIVKSEGIGELWAGCSASLILVSNPTILFVLYDLMRKALVRWRKTKNLTGFEFFMLGAISKTISTFLTYPLQLAQYSMRNSGLAKKEEKHNNVESNRKKNDHHNLLSCLIYILKNEGILGWFRGLDVKLLQTVLMTAFHFLFYEKIMSIIFTILHVQK